QARLVPRLVARGFQVFEDRQAPLGLEGVKEIERRLHAADAVIVFLSPASATRETLAYQVEIAHDAAQRRGRPRLLSVRVGYPGPLPEPLAAILDPLRNGPGGDRRTTTGWPQRSFAPSRARWCRSPWCRGGSSK